MDKKYPLVSIITVNYNGKHLLADCLDSLESLNYPKDKIETIMVDNCSTDGSVDFVKKQYPRVIILQNDVNNYCRANNLGVKNAKGDFIAFINNDLKLDKEWLVNLTGVLAQEKKIGVAVGKVLFPDGTVQGTGHYEFPDFYWADRGFKEKDNGQYEHTEDAASISHCAALYRRKCLNSIGPMDEDFMMYLEDVDMSIRLKQEGWGLVYVPESVSYHKFHGSVKDSLADFYCERNRLFLVAKHYPQKLPEAIFGKGYFTALNKRNDLLKILPDVLVKLSKHHKKEKLFLMLPGIFTEIEKIFNLEKDYLIKRADNLEKEYFSLLKDIIPQKDQQLGERERLLREKDSQLSNLGERIAQDAGIISQKDQQLGERERLLREKDSQLSNLGERIAQDAGIISQKDQQLGERERLLREKDSQLSNLGERIAQDAGIISQKDLEINRLNNKINNIYASETYRFVVMPIWRILNFFKGSSRKKTIDVKSEVLIIKPYCVSTEEAKRALDYLRNTASKTNIALLANLPESSYAQFSQDPDIKEKFLYCPTINKLTGIELIRLIIKIRKRRFSEAILLMGEPRFQGYRKAKMLATFSKAKNINVYFINSVKLDHLRPLNGWKNICSLISASALLAFVLFLFFIFFLVPLKLKRILRR